MTYLGKSECHAPRFRWLANRAIPTQLDLRRCGWILEPEIQPSPDCIGMIDACGMETGQWLPVLETLRPDVRRTVLVSGVSDPSERTALLHVGFGDVLAATTDIDELEARANRLAQFAQCLPRRRRIGRLTLDLLAREAFGDGEPLNLNPREFALIWRLADSLGETVSKESLIYDVWRMGFVPETNSVAVHMSRLRRKLAFVGLSGIIETSPNGGYRLNPPGTETGFHEARTSARSAAFAGL
ncbi:response regulator transcription factor [uncultured Novosphingobium sp.]|uniref:winged helix-turn-helix domain-containing protein n=1 Tax=uncultured Novosphingobium sp. TaxID=292277 RepID=UPI002596D8F0|nr:response regulator transcription factor [uncultured Novosphingobium sp.]